MKIKLEEFGMMDLTKIEKPFSLLDEVTQQALLNHGGPYQIYSYAGWKDLEEDFRKLATQRFHMAAYRVKPEEVK